MKEGDSKEEDSALCPVEVRELVLPWLELPTWGAVSPSLSWLRYTIVLAL